MKYLSKDEVLDIHWELADFFEKDGDPIIPAGPRDEGLVEMACSRPQTSLGGYEKYKTVDAKAAAFFHSLVKNHAFHNGNKRTALVSTAWFLDQNNRRLNVDDDELFEFVRSVADGCVPGYERTPDSDQFVQNIREWLGSRTEVRQQNPRSMRTYDFLEKVKIAGGSFREASRGGSWIVSGPNGKNIRISKSTSQLSGPAIRSYLRNLELGEAQSGIRIDEFQDGISTREDIIRRLLVVLRRLAHL